MAILLNTHAPNGAQVSFHKIVKLEITDTSSIATVAHWSAEADYLAGKGPVWHSYLQCGDSSVILAQAQAALLAGDELLGGVAVEDPGNSLESAKVRKRLQINAWRLEANASRFTYAGKEISCDRLSYGDIIGINGEVTGTGELPPTFPGAWKAQDNTYVPIPDTATWRLFYAAMVAQGITNFMHAQALKSYLDAPQRTAEEVEAVQWGMTLAP